MAEKVFVSPGVYTSEKDLTFVTRQVGVTTLGLVGETTQGPAFQPIFISNYDEFKSFFGGLNNTLFNSPIDGNGAPKYELPYIAKSYLSQSNQLFVTRVLGLSGYDAGQAWGITLDASLDPSTIQSTVFDNDPYVDYTATTGGNLVDVAMYGHLLNETFASPLTSLSFLATASNGNFFNIPLDFTKNGNTFTSATFNFSVYNVGLTVTGANPTTTGASANFNYNPIINYTGSTGGTLSTLTIADPLLNSFYNNGQFSLSSIVSSTIGSTYTIPVMISANSSTVTGVSAVYQVVSSGLSVTINSGTTTNVNTNPFIDYTADTNATLVAIDINEPLTESFYNAALFTLPNIGSSITGVTYNIPTVLTGAGGTYTGASSTYRVVTSGLTVPVLDVTTTGTSSGPTNVNPIFTWLGDVSGNLTNITLSDPLINTIYSLGGLTSLNGLATLSPGTISGTGISSFYDLGGGYTAASANYQVLSTGYTLQNVVTGATTPLPIELSAIYFSATTGGTLLDILSPQTSNASILKDLFDAQGGQLTYGDYSYWNSANWCLTPNPSFWPGSGFQYPVLTANTSNGNLAGFAVEFRTVATGITGAGLFTGLTDIGLTPYTGTSLVFVSGTSSGNTTYYSGATLQFITGVTSGNTQFYSGDSTTVITGTTSGNTIYYSGSLLTQYVTGTTSGNTTVETGTGYSDVEDKLVALLRSRGRVDSSSQQYKFQLTGSSSLDFDSSNTNAEENPLGDFNLVGTSTTLGAFSYNCSFDKTQRNYITKVLGRGAQDGKTATFVEEFYDKMFADYLADGKIRGINLETVKYAREYYDYLQEYKPAVTPFVVSELRGNKLLRLFRLWTISDGNAANEQFKISIVNIRPDTREFDVQIRAFYDNDARPSVLEAFSRCTMDPTSNNYIGRKIGTLDGVYPSKSSYVLVELDDTVDTSEAFPAGFIGYPVRDYTLNSNNDVQGPTIMYKKAYGTFENKRKVYLGLSDTIGIDADFFDYKGIPNGQDYAEWTGLTHGFHMDIDVTGATIDGVRFYINGISGDTYEPIFLFETGNWQFRTDDELVGGPYEKIYSRKFTFAPYGGYDGWDIYRTRRSNLDNFIINGTRGIAGLNAGTFKNRTLSNGDLGINSDYYAYLEAIWSFRNPEATNINVFATPGIDTFDNTNLVEETIQMIEEDRADSLYIVTTPDTDSSNAVLEVSDVVDSLDGMFDSNYTATYWPWIQILDAENNVYIHVPATRDVVRNIALTDNVSFPWFAVAGVQRGDVDAIKARKKLTLSERDALYENRINPIATFTSDGIKIWGNKTLQVKETALNRINVRRLLLQARKLISAVAIRLLFEQNDTIVRNQFLSLVNPILDNIRTERGLVDFRVVLNNDPEDIDRNQLTGKIYLKPTRSLEFIQIEFNIMNTGASFDNI